MSRRTVAKFCRQFWALQINQWEMGRELGSMLHTELPVLTLGYPHTLEMNLWTDPAQLPWALWCFILHSCTEGNAIKLYQIKVPYKVTHTNNLRKILIKLMMTCHPSTCLKLLAHFNLKRMIRYCNLCRQILHLYKSDQVCTGDKKSHTMSLAWPSISLNYKLHSCGLHNSTGRWYCKHKMKTAEHPKWATFTKGLQALSPKPIWGSDAILKKAERE